MATTPGVSVGADVSTRVGDRLTGRHVLVTGANRGIGACFVEAALERGAERVYAGARELDSLREALTRNGPRVVPIRLDVTDREQVDAAAAACPRLDLLVCNAGTSCFGGVLDHPDEAAFRAVFEVNFFGPLQLLRAFAPALERGGGGIVVVLSTGAVALSRSSPVYSASKAACLMLTLGLREQLRGRGVSLTNVFPGYVDTAMSAAVTAKKVSPRAVAERSLDGWLAGLPSVFPDRFAELVEGVLEDRMRDLLDDPRSVMSDVSRAFELDARAGS